MPESDIDRLIAGGLIVLFLLLAGCFLFDVWGHPQPLPVNPPVDLSFIDTAPVRQSYADLKKTGADLSDFDCYACHEKGKPPPLRYDVLHNLIIPEEHNTIVMGHGSHNRNNNCFNCHNETNLELLQARDGQELNFEQSSRLCGSCHGPTYRDWEAGCMAARAGCGTAILMGSSAWTAFPATTPTRPAPREDAQLPDLNRCARMATPRPELNLRMDMTEPKDSPQRGAINRRTFLKGSAVAASGVAALAASLAPLRELDDFPSMDQFLQKYYKELTPEEMDRVLKRIEQEVERDYGVRPTVRDLKPMDGVEFVYCLNLTRCIGCRKCVHACVAENNLSRSPEIQYIRVLRLPHGSLDMEKAEHNYAAETVPQPGFFYMPVQCQQCKNPPCVKVCPVHATWQEADGITVIDYDWCIGCRYCEAACPYWARRFNFAKPSVPKERLNPEMAYLGNRPRRKGVMEKCHFCIQRTRAGKYPACLEVCPAGARKFGNVLDPGSEVAHILRTKRVFIQLKEELGTHPRFFYYFDV